METGNIPYSYYNFVVDYYTFYNYCSLTTFFLGIEVYAIGEQTCVCQYCGAILWIEESVK